MVLIDPIGAILKQPRIPVDCLKCTLSFQVSSFSDDEKQSLVAMAEYQKLLKEQELLTRTANLFAQFPESKHATIVCKTIIGKKNRPSFEPDRAFDEALDRDPELKRFILRSSFNLSKRKSFIEMKVRDFRTEMSDYSIHCSECSGLLTLDEEFFESLI